MAQAQYVFVSGLSPVSPHGSEPWYAWRLLGANSRPLARGATAYPQLESCRAFVGLIPELLTRSSLRVAADLSGGMWHWQLECQQHVVAASARAYQRQRECRYNADAFALAAATAPLNDSVLRLAPGRAPGSVLGPSYRPAHALVDAGRR